MREEDLIHMTFDLAKKGMGPNWPNPLVGAVITKNGSIIGMGYHHQCGKDHAEIDAIKNCKESLEGATVYVNLEPCCHTNKQTPPCAQRLISEKVKRVVIANLDPNPEVSGKGVELLRAAGIEVATGVLALEGEKLNEVFFHVQKTRTPFIHLKLATTLDGKIALPSGESKWITGSPAREHVHEMRSFHQAVMVGAQTVRQDNPHLTVRLSDYMAAQPKRIIFTQSGNLPMDCHLLTDEFVANTLIYTHKKLSFDFPSEQVKLISSLDEAMKDLYQKKMINLMLEGGSNLAASFMKAGLINRISLYLNPSFLGDGPSALAGLEIKELNLRPKLRDVQTQWIGEDLLLTGRIN